MDKTLFALVSLTTINFFLSIMALKKVYQCLEDIRLECLELIKGLYTKEIKEMNERIKSSRDNKKHDS